MSPFLTVLGPIIATAVGGLICLASEAFLERDAKHRVLPWIATVCAFMAAAACAPGLTGPALDLHAAFSMDTVRAWLSLAVLGATVCGVAAVQHGLRRSEHPGGEGYALLLLAAVGVQVMILANHLLALFVGIELASLAIYAAVGLRRSRLEAGEALFKYLVMGAVFSAVLLFGISLIYGATGSLVYGQAALAGRDPLLILGFTLVMVGLLFKVGAVPFHFWSPDAYTGATIGVTGFMAAVMKVGGFTALGALWLNLIHALGEGAVAGALPLDAMVPVALEAGRSLGTLPLVLVSAGVLSLLLGNFSALGQTSLRRLLAYSGIAHAGYLLMALALPEAESGLFGLGGLWYYLVAYALAASGAMAAAAVMAGEDDADSFADLAGGARRHPFTGLVFTVLVASLAGFPPTAGFLGKYLIFADLVAKGEVALALVAMLMAVVGAVYYLRLILVVWGLDGQRDRVAGPALGGVGGLALVVALVATFALLALPAVIAGGAASLPVAIAGP